MTSTQSTGSTLEGIQVLQRFQSFLKLFSGISQTNRLVHDVMNAVVDGMNDERNHAQADKRSDPFTRGILALDLGAVETHPILGRFHGQEW